MAATLDDAAFFDADAFGTVATLAGSAVDAIVDTHSELVLDDVVTQGPSARILASAAPAAAAGQTFVASAVSYVVRQVLRLPPDGAVLQLVLARA